jgi:hypothetical protein
MMEVRRDGDDELCGFVAERDGAWLALTVFGGHLGRHERRADAVQDVREHGLASLADRWTLLDASSGEEQVVCIQEASPSGVTLALGYYSLPGVPSLSLSRDELAGNRWLLHRQ